MARFWLSGANIRLLVDTRDELRYWVSYVLIIKIIAIDNR